LLKSKAVRLARLACLLLGRFANTALQYVEEVLRTFSSRQMQQLKSAVSGNRYPAGGVGQGGTGPAAEHDGQTKSSPLEVITCAHLMIFKNVFVAAELQLLG